MLTRKQKWRRMRSVRYTSNSNISEATSCSDGGVGSGHIAYGGISSDTPERSRPSIAVRNSSGNTSSSSSSSENNSSPGVTPRYDRSLASVEAAATVATPSASATARPRCNGESPARPPSSLPSPPLLPTSRPQAQATLPSMRGSRPGLGPGPIELPIVSTPEEEQPQQSQPQPHSNDHRQQQSTNPFAGPGGGACHHRHPLDAWRTSALNFLKLLFLFDAGGAEDGRTRQHHHGGGGRNRAATEDCLGVATAAAARPRTPSEPVCRPPSPPPPPPKARVRFSHQIRVILVASRLEMSAVKADVWWAEKDYSDFRRAYLITAREERESNRERELDLRRRKAGVLPEQVRSEARSHESAAPQVPPPLPSITTTISIEASGARRKAAETRTRNGGGDDDCVRDGHDLFARPPDGGGGGGEENDHESGHNSRLLRTVSPCLPPPPSPESKPRTPPPPGSIPSAPLAAAVAAPASVDAEVLDDPRAAAPAADVAAGVGREHGRKVGAVVGLDTTGVKKRAPFATVTATTLADPSCGGASGPSRLLGAGKDVRIDPRTGGRVPLPFLGDAPIRRVASF